MTGAFGPGGQRCPAGGARTLGALLVLVLLLGSVAVSLPPIRAADGSGPLQGASAPSNGTGGDPSNTANDAGLCPSSGPVYLGVEWNCVAVLDLTELLLIVASIGIVAYVFRGSDRAELPGEATEPDPSVPDEKFPHQGRTLE